MTIIAVTGGTGFVGQAVLDVLAANGAAVKALARNVPHDRPSVTWVGGSLSDAAALDRLVAGVDAVLHIAGLTNTPDPAEFDMANVGGTGSVIAAMERAACRRLVFVSSLSARAPDLSAYGASKARAEALVAGSGLDWTTVRPPGVYGPRDVDYLDMFKAARLGIVPLPPGGASSMIHVDDLAQLLIALVPSSARVRHKSFEPDDGREGGWSHKEMAAAIGDAVGRRVFAPHLPRAVLLGVARLDRMVRGNSARLTADRVGYMCHPNWVARSDKAVPRDIWTPLVGTREGLKSTAQWYRDQGWL